MIHLHFQNTDEFERVFKKKDKEVTDAIAKGIQKALTSKKNTALLFEITFEKVDMSYLISLPKKQWNTALQSCLEHYTDLGESDKAIDVYLLKKQI
jgi:hypothetical protein